MASTPNNPQQLNPYAGAGMLGSGEGSPQAGGGFDPMSGAQAGVKYYDDQVAAAKKAAEEKAAAEKKAAEDAAAAAAAKKNRSRNSLAYAMSMYYPGAYGVQGGSGRSGSTGGTSYYGTGRAGDQGTYASGNSGAHANSGSIYRYGHG